MRGSLHYAAHDKTVSDFGRDDAVFPVEEREQGKDKADTCVFDLVQDAE